MGNDMKPKTNVNQMVTRDGESYRMKPSAERDAAYKACISTIVGFTADFVQVGRQWPKVAKALNQVKDDHLWQDCGECDSWPEWLDKHFQLGESYGFKLIRSLRPLLLLESSGQLSSNEPPPESHMREYAKLPDEQVVEVYQTVQDAAASRERPATAEDVKEAVTAALPAKTINPSLNKGQKGVKKRPAQRSVCPTCRGEGYLETSGGAFG